MNDGFPMVPEPKAPPSPLELRVRTQAAQLASMLATLTAVQEQQRDTNERLRMLEEDVREMVEALETILASIPPDELEQEGAEMIPGVHVKDDAVLIDERKILTWTVDEQIALGKLLPTPEDFEPLRDQPRELQRQVLERLKAMGIEPLSPEAVPDAVRGKGVEYVMPVQLPLGADSLPVVSPVWGAPVYFHVPREQWRTEGKWARMHQLAEGLRQALVGHRVWMCKGFNCHDCVEQQENIDRLVQCTQAEVRRARSPFTFVFHPEDAELVQRVALPGAE